MYQAVAEILAVVYKLKNQIKKVMINWMAERIKVKYKE